jgi:hypothetical protein
VPALEFWSAMLMVFSSSSSPLLFRSFLTRLLTAFSHHFSSCSVLNSPYNQLAASTSFLLKHLLQFLGMLRIVKVGLHFFNVNQVFSLLSKKRMELGCMNF